MKVLLCTNCVDIRSFDPDGAWTSCRCGNVQARWLDPNRGTDRVKAKDRSCARIIGLNNHFLIPGIKGATHEQMVAAGGQWEWWRKLHDEATHAEGYIFDKSKRGCWACIVQIGETNDIAWEEEPTPSP